MPDDEIFRGGGLKTYIEDHENCLAAVEEVHYEFVMMLDCSVQDLQIANLAYCQEITNLNSLVDQLLRRVIVLERHRDSLIEIPDSLAPIPIPPPGGEQLVEIEDNEVPD